jgi:hypothetical protein
VPKGNTRQSIEKHRAQWSRDFLALNPGLAGGFPGQKPPYAVPGAKTPTQQPKSPLAVKFEVLWAQLGGPALVPEHRFLKERKWRFDYALPRYMVAIELEGGIHKRKGHASPKGYISDCRKYNHAAADGWILFRLATGMMTADDVGFVLAGVNRRIKIIQALDDFG